MMPRYSLNFDNSDKNIPSHENILTIALINIHYLRSDKQKMTHRIVIVTVTFHVQHRVRNNDIKLMMNSLRKNKSELTYKTRKKLLIAA